jgi:hypothetical protein
MILDTFYPSGTIPKSVFMKCCYQLLALLLTSALTLQAEKAWDDGYRAYQDVAPEYLEIQITRVILKDGGSMFGTNSRVELQATVSQVFRSSTGLQPGKTILINYTRKSQAGPLTLDPTLPQEGQTVPAFLRWKKNHYEPAALHHSFEPLTSQQLSLLSKSVSPKSSLTANRPLIPAQTLPTANPPVTQPELPMVPEEEIHVETRTNAQDVAPRVEEETSQPRVTTPLVRSEPVEERSAAPLPVIVEALPERQPLPDPETLTPNPVETNATAPEPIVIQNVAPAAPAPDNRPAAPLLSVTAQPSVVAPPAPSSAALDQDGLTAYAAIYAKIKEGDKASANKDRATALKIYKETVMDLERLKTTKPDFQPFIVEYRQKDLSRKITAIESTSPQ